MKKQIRLSLIIGLLAFCSTAPAQLPTDLGGAGLSYIVRDTDLWYALPVAPSTYGIPTLGPVKPGTNSLGIPYQVWNNGNWEPYGGVLGDSAFLIAVPTFADDGYGYDQWDPADPGGSPGAVPVHGHQRYIVAIAPANGSTPKIVDAYYDDFGKAFTNQISSRQNGNPSRVAGDRRYGATNYITFAEASPQEWSAYFNSDNRWNHGIYSVLGIDSANRFACVQNFGIIPGIWTPKPRNKVFDNAFMFSDCGCVESGALNQQMGRTGGEVTCLSDGNFVAANEDRSTYWGWSGNCCVASIIRPDGTFLKKSFFVSGKDFWMGAVAFKGGFCIRASGGTIPGDGLNDNALVPPTAADALLFFFDNAGNCYATNTMVASSGGLQFSNKGGRGDGTGFASDIHSYYVYYTDKVPGNSGDGVVAIWDGRTGAFVTNATWTTTDPAVHDLDRFGLHVDALDRFCVAVNMCPDKNGFFKTNFNLGTQQNVNNLARQAVARVGKFDGTNISWLTPMFYPFVNHETDTNNLKGIDTAFCPTVMMTTKAICIAAKGWVNSTNNPAAGPDTANPSAFLDPPNFDPPAVVGTSNDRTTIYTIFTHPAPVEPPKPQMTITKSGNNAVLSWPYDLLDYGFWTLQSSSSLSGSWSPQANVVVAGNTAYSTNAIGAGNQFFRLARY
jgi:hypothetical protein